MARVVATVRIILDVDSDDGENKFGKVDRDAVKAAVKNAVSDFILAEDGEFLELVSEESSWLVNGVVDVK